MGFLVKSEKIPAPATMSSSGKKMRSGIHQVSSSRSVDTQEKDNSSTPSPLNRNASTNSRYSYKSTGRQSSSQAGLKPGVTPLKHKIRAARKRGMRGDVYDMQYLVEEGPLSFRSFGFFGGFFMILASFLDLMENEEEAVKRLITFNLWIIGFITNQIEARPFHLQIPFIYDIITLFFSFLKYVWGRGFLYFAAGCVQFFLFTKYNMICGVFFIILGAFSIVFGYRASVRLAGLRNSIHTRDEIKFMFHSFDRDRDGFLNLQEFREMLNAMDQHVDHNDFVAAMSAVDVDNKQVVSYEDLESWWEGYNLDDLPPGARAAAMARVSSNSSSAQLV